MNPENVLSALDSFAGLAAFINGIILWPLVKSLKKDHGDRIARLEQNRPPPKRRRASPKKAK